MHRPHAEQLPELELILGIIIPKADGEYSGVVCEQDFDASLSCFVRFAGFGLVVEVDDAAHECEVARTRFKGV